ncbi:MAG: hypothetical protein IBV52_04840 [Candidatus Bathyarchaeota archaeon]
MKIFEKPEKIVGYVLLVVGLVVVIIPTYFGFLIIFSGSSAIPKILETPTLSLDDVTIPIGNESILLPISAADVNEMIERTFPAVNLGLFLAVAVILISAGGVIMGKGVGLIKEVKLRAVRVAVGGEVEVEKEKKAMKKEN